MTNNPHTAPDTPLNEQNDDYDKIERVAKTQQMLITSVLINMTGNTIMRTNKSSSLLILLIAMGIASFTIWCIYKLCKALEVNAVVWCLAMLIPLINFICLVILNQKATTFLKSRGIKVGLLGAKL